LEMRAFTSALSRSSTLRCRFYSPLPPPVFCSSVVRARWLATASTSMPRNSVTTLNLNASVVKVPKLVMGVGGNYAAVLYQAASQKKAVEATEKDVLLLNKAVQDPKVVQLFGNPLSALAFQLTSIKQIAEKLQLNPLTTSFLELVVKKKRGASLAKILSEFAAICESGRGRIDGVITSAKPLTEEHMKEIGKQVNHLASRVFGKTQNVNLTPRIDENIVAGLHVTFGSYEVDLTARTRINDTLTKALVKLRELQALRTKQWNSLVY